MKLLTLLIFSAALVSAQVKDTSPRNFYSGASAPAACAVGDVFFKTGVVAGSNLYGCTATDTWTLQGGAGGSGNMLVTLGATDPTGACAVGTAYYLQTTLHTLWHCPVSGAWEKFLSTTNTGPYVQTSPTGTTPVTPVPAGEATIYLNSTSKTLKVLDDAGTESSTVRALTCTGVNFISSINALGVPVCTAPTASGSISIALDGGGSTIATGLKGCRAVPWAGTIGGTWTVSNTDATGSIAVDVWKAAFSASTNPTSANTIVASTPPTLTSTRNATGATTGWTPTSFAKDDLFCFSVTSVTTLTRADISFAVTHQ